MSLTRKCTVRVPSYALKEGIHEQSHLRDMAKVSLMTC